MAQTRERGAYLLHVALTFEPFVARCASIGFPVIMLIHVLFSLCPGIKGALAGLAIKRLAPMIIVVHVISGVVPLVPGLIAGFALVNVTNCIRVLPRRLPAVELAIADSAFRVHGHCCCVAQPSICNATGLKIDEK